MHIINYFCINNKNKVIIKKRIPKYIKLKQFKKGAKKAPFLIKKNCILKKIKVKIILKGR